MRTGLIPTHAGKTFEAVPSIHGSEAHPHSRGENAADGGLARHGQGSSPLTRGKPRYQARRLPARGLIPTHAGKTPRPPGRPSQARAHPHSRGENFRARAEALSPRGSSPLTRGKRAARQRPWYARGLIPTHAGKTDAGALSEAVDRAHPHSRGENAVPGEGLAGDCGSSPLTRGKRPVPGLQGGHPGLIPTHAGKTPRRRRGAWTSGAHPHSRGENSVFAGPR